MGDRTAAVIVNPISGRKGRKAALAAAVDRLRGGGIDTEVWETACAGDAPRLARQAVAQGVDIVIAAGGDGTVNETAAGLLGGGDVPPLGILPLGTSNLVARDLALPLDPARAAGAILTGVPRAFDVGLAGEKPFLACAGVGWDAHVVRCLSESRRGHIRFRSYIAPVLRATVSYPFPRLTVTSAEGETVEGEVCLVLNARPYAAFFVPVPEARPDDGLLDAVVLEKRGLLDVPRWMWHARRGRLGHGPGAKLLRSTSFHVTSDAPAPYQIDGDVGAETPVDIVVRPGALRLLAPAASR